MVELRPDEIITPPAGGTVVGRAVTPRDSSVTPTAAPLAVAPLRAPSVAVPPPPQATLDSLLATPLADLGRSDGDDYFTAQPFGSPAPGTPL